MVHIQVHNGNKKARLTEVVAGGTPVGTAALGSTVTWLGTHAEYLMLPICSLKKNSKRHVRQESSCPSYNLNCLSLYFV
jgi:hypothetical protein